LVKCPECGVEVSEPKKSWVIKSSKSKKTIKIGLFECPTCRKKFRAAV